VFLSTYQATGAYVAVKYLNATLRRDEEFMARLRTQAPALVEIDEPNAVRLHEYVETRDRAAVVMELVDGVSLRTLLDEHGRTSPEAALALLKGTLLALAAAHAKGVAHRDVKPGNVLVQADGTSKLGDFGIVVHAEEPGVPAGSPPYMSPELWTHGEAGPSADVYAAACLLFEAVRGRPPYRAQDVPSLREKHLDESVPLEVVPDALRDLLRRGLAKDPQYRYATAAEFAAALEEEAVAAYGPEWEQRGRRHLGELATLLALRFPLAGSGDGSRDRVRRMPRMPKLRPNLWIAGATGAALLIGVLLTGGRLSGPGTVLMPPPETSGAPESGPADATTPARGTSPAPATKRPTGDRPNGRRTTADPPTGGGPTGNRPTAGTSAPPSSSTAPSGAPTPHPRPRPSVRSADIMRWSGSAGEVRVAAEGTGPVQVRISYTRRDGDGPARTVAEETRTLTGRTLYTGDVLRDLGDVACGTRAHFGIVLLTEPAAGNGPQVREVPVDGDPCPSPTPTPAPDGTGPPGTPTPSQGALARPEPSGQASPPPASGSPHRVEVAGPDDPPPS
jgi:serine/threonine-protein kinase